MPYKTFGQLDAERKKVVVDENQIKEANERYNQEAEKYNNKQGRISGTKPYKITLSEYQTKLEEIQSTNGIRNFGESDSVPYYYSVIDNKYKARLESPNNLYSADFDDEEINDIDFYENEMDEKLHENVFKEKKVSPDVIARFVINSIPTDEHSTPLIKNYEKECVDINNMKNYAISSLTGHGDPTNAHISFLDEEALENHIYKLDYNKVDKFINSLNKSLDKRTEPIRDVNSLYNKTNAFTNLENAGANFIYNSCEKIMRDNGLQINQNKNLEDFSKAFLEGNIKNFDSKDFERILSNYNSLKDKLDGYTPDIKKARKEEYKFDKNIQKATMKMLKSAFGFKDSDFVDGKINVEEKLNEFKDLNIDPSGVSLRLSTQKLIDSANEYNSHGRIWKFFLGRRLRGEINKCANNLDKLGVPRNYVNAIKNGNTTPEFFENEYNDLANNLSGIASISKSEVKAINDRFNVLNMMCNDEHIKNVVNGAKIIFNNAVSNATINDPEAAYPTINFNHEMIFQDFSDAVVNFSNINEENTIIHDEEFQNKIEEQFNEAKNDSLVNNNEIGEKVNVNNLDNDDLNISTEDVI